MSYYNEFKSKLIFISIIIKIFYCLKNYIKIMKIYLLVMNYYDKI